MYKEDLLITTKFNIPVTSSKVVKRSRLFKKLDMFIEYKLILVTATAGYGKTTLVTSWLEEKKKSKVIVAWLSLDEEDNDVECFWSYFLWSLYNKVSKINEAGENVKKLYKSSAGFNKLYIAELINIVDKLNEEILMIVDDFHVITQDKIMDDIKFLIKNMPSNMHILIISRNLPQFGLARLRAADNLLEINQYDLYFTCEETNEFFHKASGTDLTSEKCNMLWNNTEGWAAGIQMTALAIKNSGERNFDNTYKNNEFIFEYIGEEVFSSLNESVKKFLLYTSILNEFSYEICNYLLDIENSMEIIKDIESANLFLISLDDEHTCFHYHNLFKNFLRKQLDTLEVEFVHKLFGKVAQWYESNKQINKAVENYIKALDFKKAVWLIEQVSGEILCTGRAKALHKWNEMLPKDVVRTNSRLIMNSAWAASADGKTNQVLSYIMMAKNCNHTHKGIKAEIAALSSTNITDLNDLDGIIEECKSVLKSLEPKEFLTQLIIFNMAKIYLLKGSLIEAVHYFEKCLSISIETDKVYISILSNKALIMLKKLKGEYGQCEKKCVELISELKVNGDILFPVTGILYAELSDIYYQWNELEKSMDMAKKGLKLGLHGEDIWTAAENYLLLAKVYKSLGFNNEYMDAAYKVEEYIKSDEFFDIRVSLESYKAEIMIKEGNILPVLKWLNHITPLINDDMIILYTEVYVVKIKVYIYENDFHKARKLLNILQENAEKCKAYSLLVNVRILSAIIYEKSGNRNEAINELEKAVELAWKQKVKRVFLDEGNFMEDMLKSLRKNIAGNSKPDIVRYIDELLTDFKPDFVPKITEHEEILSKREIEVLDFIRKGYTNSEISAKLFISINTVKTHLLNIYTKLDVHSRTRAVAKAKELNLI